MVYLYAECLPLPIKFKRMENGWKFLPQIPQMNTVICQSTNQRPLWTKHTHTQKKDSKFVIHYILNILFYFKRLNIQPKATGNVRKKDKTKREEMTIQMDRAELTSLTRNSSWMTADPLSCWQ